MKILQQGNNFRLISEFNIQDLLEPKYYELEWDNFGNVFLKQIEDLILPSKLYDFSKRNRELLLNSFNNNDKNLGILLEGDKGTGKTMDAKMLCKELNLPKILVTKKIPKNVDYIAFLQSIEQSFVLYIDEFEKLFKSYDDNGDDYHIQDSLLTILDGLNNAHKKLFIFTSNNEVSNYFINRPSRIKYHIKYQGILEENAKIIVNDLLVNKSLGKDLLENIDLQSLTIDLLISMIQEVNIHNIPYSQFKNIFNYNIEEQEFLAYEKESITDDFRLIDCDLNFSILKRIEFYFNGQCFTKLSKDNSDIILFSSKKDKNHILKFELVTKKLDLVF